MTLIELLVSVSAMALIVTVISTAVVVTLRQQSSTQARTDVARWEQALALWLPADLASASGVDAEAGSKPAGCGAVCDETSNVLELTWGVAPDVTTVSYRYGPDSGDGYLLARVECASNGSCTSQVVLRDLASPDPGWTAGQPVPKRIIEVDVPLAVDATDEGDVDTTSSAQRVIVFVNGAPDQDGTVRSTRVSFTAGGSQRLELGTPTFEGPTFLDAQSGCGGPITLIVDESGSIGNADDDVEDAVENFIDTFAGTPTRLQVIEFSTRSRVVGASGSEWTKYFDLTETSQVNSLKAALDVDSSARGVTNWEDALFRTFRDRNGGPYDGQDPTAPIPELVVFFTDGLPTYDRDQQRSDSADEAMNIDNPYNYTRHQAGAGYVFSPRGWFRASEVIDRNIDMIGVGVGGAFGSDTRVERSGWPASWSWRFGWRYTPIDNEVFLGDLIAGGLPHLDGTSSSGQYVKREYAGGWSDVENADLLVSNNLDNLASALAEIALSECGGTLTVQTRTDAGATSKIDVTYRVGSEQSTTSAVRKAAIFDVATESGAAATVQLLPEIQTPGWTATDWSCTSRGVDLGSDYGLVDGDDAALGIDVTVRANAAVSCTMTVSGS